MPGETNTRCNALWKKNRLAGFFVLTGSLRLSLPFDEGQIEVSKTDPVGIFRAQPDLDYPFESDQVFFLQSFKPLHDKLVERGYYILDEDQAPPFELVVVHATRSKIESQGLIGKAMRMVKPGGFVLVDGAKTDGIESLLKKCKSGHIVDGLISKSHGKLFWMQRPLKLPNVFTAWEGALAPAQKAHGYVTAPGMFSPDKIDQGSILLAEEAKLGAKGRVADLGAGWGWLACQILLGDKTTSIDLFEVENTALDSARLNITDRRAAFIWQDVQNLKTDGLYDTVVCNPPFHQGRTAEPTLGISFIQKAAEILKPNGILYLVANRQLPYEDALNQSFAHWKFLKETNQFKVIQAQKPVHHRKSNRIPLSSP